jgi:hypothetical protein
MVIIAYYFILVVTNNILLPINYYSLYSNQNTSYLPTNKYTKPSLSAILALRALILMFHSIIRPLHSMKKLPLPLTLSSNLFAMTYRSCNNLRLPLMYMLNNFIHTVQKVSGVLSGGTQSQQSKNYASHDLDFTV